MTTHPTNSDEVQALLARAGAQGTLSPQTSTLLSGDLGAMAVAGAAGMHVDDIQASDVTLLTLVLDRSSSIAERKLVDAVCEGERSLLDALGGATEKDAVLVSLWTFASDARVVHGYVPVDDATRLDATSLGVGGATHLYDTFCDACAANVAYAQQLRDAGTPTRSLVVIVTDGEDVGSRRPARTCARIARDLLRSEQFVLAFVGVGNDVDFVKVAKSMGFPDGAILVQKDATPQGLRSVFQMVSRSAVRASRGQIAPGPNAGFFSP